MWKSSGIGRREGTGLTRVERVGYTFYNACGCISAFVCVVCTFVVVSALSCGAGVIVHARFSLAPHFS